MKAPTWSKDLALLVARILVGVVFIAHGAQKIFTWTLPGTADAFAGMGVPAPQVSSAVAAVIELGGGIALVLGLGTAIAGVVLALNMLGAYYFAHLGSGVFVDAGGFELVAVLGAASLVLAASGAGAFSVDRLVRGRREPVAA